MCPGATNNLIVRYTSNTSSGVIPVIHYYLLFEERETVEGEGRD